MSKAAQHGLFAKEEEQAEMWLDGFRKEDKKEAAMADELSVELRETNDKLNALLDVLTDQTRGRRGRRREPDEPESVRDMDVRGRQGEARQVAFEIKVPVGRNGGTLKGLLIFDVPVRDDRDLEDLANEVERKFRSANVFSKQDYGGRGGFNGGGNGYGGGWRGGGGWDRDREWRR